MKNIIQKQIQIFMLTMMLLILGKKELRIKLNYKKNWGLTEDSKKFMIGMCTRLTDQKD